MDAVIPAYPYEGAFLWFLGDDTSRGFRGGYYETLYGELPENASIRAAALTCLFPQVILAPADAQLPDSANYLRGSKYDHPDLRISVNWLMEQEWSDENREIAKAAASDPQVEKLLSSVPHIRHETLRRDQFLYRLVLQNRLALSTGGTLIGNSLFHQLSIQVSPYLGVLSSTVKPRPARLTLTERTLDVVGLNFAPGTREAYAAIRSSSAITDYAESFRTALVSASTQADLDNALLGLMREAMDKSEVAKHVAGGLQTSGSAINLVGFIPYVGTAASFLGVGADAGARVAEKLADKNAWYLIGAKMQEVAIRDLLKRSTSKEPDRNQSR